MTVRYQESPTCLSKSMCVFDEGLEDIPKKKTEQSIHFLKRRPPQQSEQSKTFTFFSFVDKDTPFTMPAIDHVPRLLGQRDILLDNWLAHVTISQNSRA